MGSAWVLAAAAAASACAAFTTSDSPRSVFNPRSGLLCPVWTTTGVSSAAALRTTFRILDAALTSGAASACTAAAAAAAASACLANPAATAAATSASAG